MAKKQQTWVPADIDPTYEAQFSRLESVQGTVHDYEFDEPAPEVKRQLPAVQPPQRPTIRRISRQISQTEAAIVQQAAAPIYIQTEGALQAQDGAQEKTSGKDRSWALLIRLIPWAAIFIILAIAVAISLVALADADDVSAFVAALLAFIGPTGWMYLRMDKQERYDSRNGVEHHKIDSAERLTEKRLEHEFKLRQMALGYMLKMLNGGDQDDRQ